VIDGDAVIHELVLAAPPGQVFEMFTGPSGWSSPWGWTDPGFGLEPAPPGSR